MTDDQILEFIQTKISGEAKKILKYLAKDGIEIYIDKQLIEKSENDFGIGPADEISVWINGRFDMSMNSRADLFSLWNAIKGYKEIEFIKFDRLEKFECTTSGLTRTSKVHKFNPRVADIMSMVEI